MTVLVVLLLIVVSIILFLQYYPHFGRKPSKSQRAAFTEQSSQYRDNRFRNEIQTRMGMENMSAKDWYSMIMDFTVRKHPGRKPTTPVQTVPFQWSNEAYVEGTITWFGHSALLLQLRGKRILVDPMFGNNPSPFPQFSTTRYSKTVPFQLDDIPEIDVVLLSHDHYDHLDYPTIAAIQQKVKQFIVPLGVGSHLRRWGIEENRIIEKDWWQDIVIEDFRFICTPARHFSGRSVHDAQQTLWCSWVVQTDGANIFFSGDSGYGPHFKEIGERYGPFDFTCIECGQYDERWRDIHMFPEETVQACIDVKGKRVLPIHWGAFTLSIHSWTDPIERAVQKAEQEGVPIVTPKIGEPVSIFNDTTTRTNWWRES